MAEDNDRKKSKFPRKMLIWTGLVSIFVFVLHWQAFYINEKINLDPAIASLVTFGLGTLLVITWGFWAIFWARRYLVGLLIFLVPIGFFTLYYPNLSGDMQILGFKPRYWESAASYVEPVSSNNVSPVDLTTTTPSDFPQFLGPNRNAMITGVNLANDWDEPPTELWKIGIGEGWSGFVTVNGFAVTQEQRSADECVTCYDINTGELLWIQRENRRHEDLAAMGKVGPRATPVIDDGLVYAASATGILDCLDGSTGELVWSANVPQMVGIEQVIEENSAGLKYSTETSRMAWGRSSSPLIVGDLVVISAGGPDQASDDEDPTATLIAFDKKTGGEIWRGGKRMASYGSPSLATVDGKQQILMMAERHAVGHDPETGEELWSFAKRGSSNADANCSQVTVVDGNRLILSKGYNEGGEMIEVTQDGEQWNVKSLHKDARILKTKITNPVIHNGYVYSLSDGYLECAEVDTFKRQWKQRGRFGNGQVLLVGDKLLVHSEYGRLYLVQANPSEYEELGAFDTIDGICWNTICLDGDLVLVRSELEAACYRLPTEPQ